MVKKLKVAKDFSSSPGPRYKSEGPNSGEKFREDMLVPIFRECLKEGRTLEVDLDGTAGYGTSFLEEAFGGLIREDGFSFEDVSTKIRFVSEEEPFLIEDINEYLNDVNLQPA